MKKSLINSAILPLIFSLLLTACGETKDAAYSDWVAAQEDGAIERGWIPNWLPRSSQNLKEAHDLDSNASILALTFSEDENWQVPDSCEPAQEELPAPGLKRVWWPSRLHKRPDRYLVFYVCRKSKTIRLKTSYLAIQGNKIYFWRP
ncbi:MAG: hypothetical protein F6J87_06895 [Spirulina sp. SIO3F2]|nr:hypothetical protein [Spirulina sp. SIO3F2]